MSKDGTVGLKTVLHKCSFNKDHNFNLLNMSKLLNKQVWKRTQEDKSLICIENGKGKVINFDIEVPTAKGTIEVCKFI